MRAAVGTIPKAEVENTSEGEACAKSSTSATGMKILKLYTGLISITGYGLGSAVRGLGR
jgi:hypothetical protein